MTQRIRLLCYIGSLDPGGAERQVVTLLQHLDRQVFEPRLLLAHRQGALLSEVPDDIPVLCATPDGKVWPGMLRWRRVRQFARILEEHHIDVVYDRTYLATLDAAVACWLRPTPRVSAAVADPAVQFEMYAKRPRWLWRRFSRRAYQSATRVLANSEGLRQQLLQFWQLPPDRVLVQPNAYDFDEMTRRAGQTSVRSESRITLLTVGRIDADKGHADLLAALAMIVAEAVVPQLVWRIVGTGPGLVALQEQVLQLGLSGRVEFAGQVTNPYAEYRNADLFCLPSRTEGLPNVLIEALGCGVPVISTDCPSGPREILQDGAYGRLVPVRDPAAMAEAIRDFLRERAAWQEQARRGQLAMRDQYTASVVVPQLAAILQDAAGL
ncbi:glycosyltransferase [bacterium]|nr:glycosyltransferase [bacterium]